MKTQMSRDFSITLDKANFAVEENKNIIIIVYTVNVFKFFLRYFLIFTIFGLVANIFYPPWYNTMLIIGMLFWVGTVVSHKFVFNSIVKKIFHAIFFTNFLVKKMFCNVFALIP